MSDFEDMPYDLSDYNFDELNDIQTNENSETNNQIIVNEENKTKEELNTDDINNQNEEKLALFILIGFNDFYSSIFKLSDDEFLSFMEARKEYANDKKYLDIGKNILYKILKPSFEKRIDLKKISETNEIDIDIINQLYDRFHREESINAIKEETHKIDTKTMNQIDNILDPDNSTQDYPSKEKVSNLDSTKTTDIKGTYLNNTNNNTPNIINNDDIFDLLNQYKNKKTLNLIKNIRKEINELYNKIKDYLIVSKEAELIVNINHENIIYEINNGNLLINNMKYENIDENNLINLTNINEDIDIIVLLLKNKIKEDLTKKINNL